MVSWCYFILCSLAFLHGLKVGRVGRRAVPLTPLKLYILFRRDFSLGPILFSSLRYDKSYKSFNALYRAKALDFSPYFNKACKSLSYRQLLQIRGRLEDPSILSVSCLDRLPFLNQLDHTLTTSGPSLILNYVPKSLQWSKTAMKNLLKNTVSSPETTSSIFACKWLAKIHQNFDLSSLEHAWKLADASCLVTEPSLASILLPDVYEVNLDPTCVMGSLEKLLHVIATVLMISRMEEEPNRIKPILQPILDEKLENLKLFRDIYGDTTELTLIHEVLGSYLVQLLRRCLNSPELRNLQAELQVLKDSLLRLWNVAEGMEPRTLYRGHRAMRQSILLILLELAPSEDLTDLTGYLESILVGYSVQKRILCLLLDVLQTKHYLQARPLIQMIHDYLNKTGSGKLACCNGHGCTQIFPTEASRKVELRRRTIKATVNLTRSSHWKGHPIFRPHVNINLMRKQLYRKFISLLSQYAVIVSFTEHGRPEIILKMETHPYKARQLWDTMLLLNMLRVKLPVSIHSTQYSAFIFAVSKLKECLFRFCTAKQFSANVPTDIKTETIRAISAYRAFQQPYVPFFNSPKASYRYYCSGFFKNGLILQEAFGSQSEILSEYRRVWDRNMVIVDDILSFGHFIRQDPEQFATYLVTCSIK